MLLGRPIVCQYLTWDVEIAHSAIFLGSAFGNITATWDLTGINTIFYVPKKLFRHSLELPLTEQMGPYSHIQVHTLSLKILQELEVRWRAKLDFG